MKCFTTTTIAVSTAAALLFGQVAASPVAAVSLQNRQSQIASAVIQIFREIFKGSQLAFPDKVNAW